MSGTLSFTTPGKQAQRSAVHLKMLNIHNLEPGTRERSIERTERRNTCS